MKRRSRACPNNPDHTMHRAFVLRVQEGRRRWLSTPWQYCPVCRVMLPDS